MTHRPATASEARTTGGRARSTSIWRWTGRKLSSGHLTYDSRASRPPASPSQNFGREAEDGDAGFLGEEILDAAEALLEELDVVLGERHESDVIASGEGGIAHLMARAT